MFGLTNTALVERAMQDYTELLYRIAYYYVEDAQLAEDTVQDVFMKLYVSNYEEQGELKAYLSKMTANACKDYLKSWAYRKVKLADTFFKQQTTIHKDVLIYQDELTVLDAAILALPLKQREAIVYYYLENLPVSAIAHIVNRPESTVKSRLQSGRKMLKKHLANEEWEVLLK